MIITKLYTGEDGKSHFEDMDCEHESHNSAQSSRVKVA